MSKEAMKLALEALDNLMYWDNGKSDYDQARQAIAALQEALAKPDFWEGYVPEPDSTCSNALRIQHKPYPRTCKKCGLGPCVELAQQALDKKAENARELGLDYEPVCNKDPQGCWNVRCQLGKKCKNTQAQRTWVGLVWGELPEDGQNHDFLRGAVWAETKLKEKNT